jgi:transposase
MEHDAGDLAAAQAAGVAVTLQPADEGDTTTWLATVEQACQHLQAVAEDPLTAAHVPPLPVQELVTDKGYHSNQTMTDYRALGVRSYVAEPRRGRRQWEGQTAARDAVYANRRRVQGARGQRLLRQRGELIERSFAHCYETGGMRRTHLRGHPNILKRLLVHVAGFNLSLILRKLLPRGTPRGLQDLGAAARAALVACGAAIAGLWAARRERAARSGRLGRGWRVPVARSAPLRQAA